MNVNKQNKHEESRKRVLDILDILDTVIKEGLWGNEMETKTWNDVKKKKGCVKIRLRVRLPGQYSG